MKPDVRVLKCLCQLQEPGFEPLLEWLRHERGRQMELMVSLNDEAATQLHQLQGRARALGDLLMQIDTAREMLHKLER